MSKYVALLARTGARPLALACGLGWLSFASYGFAIVLAVADATGSFAVAGGAVGAFSAGSALLAPFRGRYVDRHGPRALARFAPVHAVALGLLVVGCLTTDSSWLLVGTAGIAGLFTPPLIATARAVWPEVAGSELVTTAHALNAALVLVVVGAGFGLLNVAMFELLDDIVAPDRAIEAWTWLTTWQGLGLAAGATLSGQLSTSGPSASLVVVAAPGLLAAVAAVSRRSTLQGRAETA
jgi:MFS family permease